MTRYRIINDITRQSLTASDHKTMLTTYQLNKNIESCKRIIEANPGDALAKKRATARLAYYMKKGAVNVKRIDHATPTHQVTITRTKEGFTTTPIAKEEVYTTDIVTKASHVALVVAVLLLITIVWVNVAR